MTDDRTHDEKIEKLREIVNSTRTAFLVTHAEDGTLHGRPMATAEVEDDFDTIWLSTPRDSGKVHEIAQDQRVLLGFNNASGSEWASIAGTARVVDDRAKIHELWSPYWKNWFDGPDDPRLVLIAITPEKAEYWDTGSQVVAMIKFALAAITGQSSTKARTRK